MKHFVQIYGSNSFFFSFLMLLIAQAKNCHRVWTCKGDTSCWEDCTSQHNGKGLCDLYTAPSVPKQCFCAYKC